MAASAKKDKEAALKAAEGTVKKLKDDAAKNGELYISLAKKALEKVRPRRAAAWLRA